ncbi:hypothetical protein ACLOJK_017789 [Asimina triloba]
MLPPKQIPTQTRKVKPKGHGSATVSNHSGRKKTATVSNHSGRKKTPHRTVISTKSVEYMPFLLSLFLFLNGAVWTFWSFLEKDYFVGIPNGIGFILGTAQLLLYAIYMNADGRKGEYSNLSDAAEPFIQSSEAHEGDIEEAHESRKI